MTSFSYRTAHFKIREFITNFFTKGHQRTLEAKKNIAASIAIKGISIAINLALVPLTIHYVNPTQYGIWLTLSSIIAWFGFFDIGFGNGLRNRFSEAKATGNTEKARTYVSTTYAILTLIFSTVWLIFIAANYFINWSKILNTPNEMSAELTLLAILVFGFFCLRIILLTINTILIADQKPAIAGLADTLGQLLALLIIFLLVKTTKGSLIALALSLGFAPLLVLITLSFLFFNGKYKLISPSIKNVDFSYAKDIMNIGFKFFLIQIGVMVIFQTSNIIISQMLGPEQVTVYNIAYKYFFVLSMAFMIIVSPFWSAFTEAYTKQDFAWMKGVIKKLNLIWLLCIPIALIMLGLANIIFKLWIGNSVTIPIEVSIFLAIYVLLANRFNLFIFLINGIGKIQLQLYVYLSVCLIYIPIAVYFCKWFGLKGIVWANIIVAIVFSIISEIQINKLMNNKAKGIWNK